MRKVVGLAAFMLIGVSGVFAAEFSGYLMDTMCAAKKLDQASAHTAECMENCSKSGFGLVTKDGKYLKFNETGNAKALKALRASNKRDNLLVKVTGELDGSVIQVNSIAMQ